MRVLQVIARLNFGGTAGQLLHMTNLLPRYGIDVVTATGHVQGGEQEDPRISELEVERVAHLGRKLNLSDDLRARAELNDLIERVQPDLIHTHTFKAGLIGRTLPRNIARVHTFHGHLFDDPSFAGPKAQVIAGVERLLAPCTDAIVTVGAQVIEDLLARKIGKREQYMNILPGVVPLTLPSREQAREILGLTQDALVVGWLARVTAVKAPMRVVELAEQFPDVTFLMGSSGDLIDLVRAAAPRNLRVLGFTDAAALYAASDIALSTSTNEGVPASLVEAQLAGLPVVSTRVGSVAEAVVHGETGLLSTPEGLGDALRILLDDPAMRHAFGDAGRARSQQLFSPEHMVAQHAALYQRVLDDYK